MIPNSSDIILESLRDGVLIVNTSGEIIFCNKAAQNLFSKPASELIGKPFGFPVTSAEVQEIELFVNNRILTVQMAGTLIHWDGQDAYLLSLREITELKKISKELEMQKFKLEMSNRELEQYASFASHDLKEPIRKIMIFATRLLRNDNIQSVPDITMQVEKILQCGERMNSLVSGIAEYSGHTGDQNFATVDLNEVVHDVMSDLEEHITEKKARLHVEPLPVIEADPIQMHKLFLNLLSNSIKYSKKDVAPEISVRATDQGSHVRLAIADNGIGFNQSHANKIFEPFQRLHSKEYEGSGIGLAICKRIVESHGGAISFKSVPGDGAEFSFTLAKNPSADLFHEI
jgi:light-regulated signal transduction histidine kinase (bacteriophytochrome)